MKRIAALFLFLFLFLFLISGAVSAYAADTTGQGKAVVQKKSTIAAKDKAGPPVALIPGAPEAPTPPVPVMEPDDVVKVTALLNTLDEPGVIFIQNGEEHAGAWGQEHLQNMLAIDADKIKTVDDFITHIGTTSRKGNPYQIKTKEGKIVSSADWFKDHLVEISKGAPQPETKSDKPSEKKSNKPSGKKADKKKAAIDPS